MQLKKWFTFSILLGIGISVWLFAIQTSAQVVNIAYNPTRAGFPQPLESDPGWGGGAVVWDILDGQTYYTDTWAHGLAFTGGFPGWITPCGWRQATVNFGVPKSFNQALVWHHGWEHIPTIYHLEFWNGSTWLPTGGNSSVRWDLETPPAGVPGWGAVPTEHIFPTVSASKIRFVVNNCDIQHGWIYEFEVFLSELQVPVDIKPSSCPNPFNMKGKGVLPMAISGTVDIDVTQIDPTTIKIIWDDPDVGISPLRWSIEDTTAPFEPFVGKPLDANSCHALGMDDFKDLNLKFDVPALASILAGASDGEIVKIHLTGNLMEEFGGTPITGEDVIKVINKP